MAASVALTSDQLTHYSASFNEERANLVATNAAVSAGILEAAKSNKGLRELPRTFNVELKQGSITNQQQSGRCWMFASLNTLRFELMHKWNLEDFEFSESYLFFFDKLEKSNRYLENVLATLDETTDSRLFQAINGNPVGDGGLWQMFVALVRKYGLMPKDAYPESANSRHSAEFGQYLNTVLRQFAAALRDGHKAGKSVDELRALKEEQMASVYRICAISMGEPPATFDLQLRTKAGSDNKDSSDEEGKKGLPAGVNTDKVIEEHGITPRQFVEKYVPMDLDAFVCLANSPMESTPFFHRYHCKFSGNVAEESPIEFVNVPTDVFVKAAIDQLKAGHPIWFACDCMQFSLRKEGVFDKASVRVDELFNVEFTSDKAHGIEYRDSTCNHAMTLTGVNLDADGKPNRWKVENSWGKDNGKDGYFVASKAWFERYVQQLIIRKDFLDKDTLATLESEPIELEPWQTVNVECE